jgi:hypothetical protein
MLLILARMAGSTGSSDDGFGISNVVLISYLSGEMELIGSSESSQYR